jgi:DNA polymerase-1
VKYLQLYTEPQLASVEQVASLDIDPGCIDCPLHESCKHPCLAPEGNEEKGGLLIVSDHPLVADDARGRPYSSTLGAKLRRIIREHWDGPVYLDYAIKCAPKKGKRITDKPIAACRPYLAKTIEECEPSKIIVMGATAMKSILGRGAGPFSTRKCFGWLEQTQTPVFMLMSHYIALNNRFLTDWFTEDLTWALRQNVRDLRDQSSRDGIASLITTKEESEEAVEILKSGEWVCYDTETVGKMFNKDFQVISIAICNKDDEDAYVWSEEALQDKEIMQPVFDMMEDPSVLKVAQNAKYDSNAMYSSFGIEVKGLHLDTRLIRKILEPESVAKLDVLQEQVGMGGGKEIASKAIADIGKKLKKAETDIDLAAIGPVAWTKPLHNKTCAMGVYAYGLIDKDVRDRYCGRDTVSTARVAELYEQRLLGTSIKTVWEDIMLPAAKAIEHVERWGVAVDREFVGKFEGVVTREMESTLSKLFMRGTFNLNSTRELGERLYTVYKLPVVSKTATGNPSTDRATLDMLAARDLDPEQQEFVDTMLAYRKLSKMHSTYATKLGGFIRSDGRVHPSFNLVGARSGRISCSDPNVQQIPRADTELSSMARDCFTAPKGRMLVQVDYSQLELRIAAMLSDDKNMIDVFKSGEDYHMRTAQLISKQAWGIEPDQVTKVHRTMAKSVNFGLLYGMSIGTLAKNIGCEKSEAMKIQNAVFGSFPNLKRWCDDHVQMARRTGNGYTYWKGKKARIRPLFKIADQEDHARKTAENGSFNTPVQGTASDLCLASLARCVNWILEHKFPAKMVLTVHDSLLFEVAEDYVDEMVETAQHLMSDWESNGVPLVVDAEIGKSWGRLRNYT